VAVVLGIAQDGGVPQANCRCERCSRARRGPRHAHRVASLALLDAVEGKSFLIDATIDLREQLDALASDPVVPLPQGRTPLEGVLLTHAHVGHYAGLVHFGREAMGSRQLPLFVTARMRRFIESNAPWSKLLEQGHARLIEIKPDEPVELTPRLRVTPVLVPHRDELSDTVAYVVEGPSRKLLWLPDIDRWEKWQRSLEDVLDEVDLAFLDGTFYSTDELPDRDISGIPHPLVRDTVERLEASAAAHPRRAKVCFVHLNHSNPLLGPGTRLSRELEARGFEVASEGQRVEL
jgi:pyrroloquinoline quinone biosynthesis protein B